MNERTVYFETSEIGFRFEFIDAIFACQARKLFILYLEGQADTDSNVFAAEVSLGELVGNAARHGAGAVEVQLLWLDSGARLAVIDHGPGYTLQDRLSDDPFQESHRGHFLVSVLGSDLCVDRREGATVTSVTLPVQRRRL